MKPLPATASMGPRTTACLAMACTMACAGPACAQGVSADALFDWAEQSYSTHFPGHRPTQVQAPYKYRHYPETGNYLGVAGADVYVFGPVGAGQLLRVGALPDFTCLVVPASCPQPVSASVGRLARMAQGLGYTLAVDSNGDVLAWGSGTTGLRTPVPGSMAWRINGLHDVVAVFSTLRGTNFALKRDGRVFGWGSEVNNNLGSPQPATTRPVPEPVQVPGLTNIVDLVPTIAGSGWVSYFALRADGTVWSSPGAAGPATVKPPEQVPGLPPIVALSEYQANLEAAGAGAQQAYGIDEAGHVWQIIAVSAPGPSAQWVNGLNQITQVSCTDNHCLALDRQGDVWAWGSNTVGQLGDGTQRDRPAPFKLAALKNVRKVLATGHSSFALTSSSVYSWGYRAAATNPNPLVPTEILSHANAIVDLYPSSDIPAGSRFMVYRDGRVRANGLNFQGTLGDGTSKDALIDKSPVTVLGVNLGGS